jgi:hypothetical protein
LSGVSLLGRQAREHGRNALWRDGSPGSLTFDHARVVSVCPNLCLAQLDELGQSADVIEVVVGNDDAADGLWRLANRV